MPSPLMPYATSSIATPPLDGSATQWQLLATTTLAGHETALARLLQEVVQDGASIGFLPPLTLADALAYWRGVALSLQRGERLLWLALAHTEQGVNLLGTVQLALCNKANGRHRAEVEKLMVAPHARGLGIGRALMTALEQAASQAGRSLLVLDTRVGDVASLLYLGLGYQGAGQIPAFAINGDGSLAATQFFYKQTVPAC